MQVPVFVTVIIAIAVGLLCLAVGAVAGYQRRIYPVSHPSGQPDPLLLLQKRPSSLPPHCLLLTCRNGIIRFSCS